MGAGALKDIKSAYRVAVKGLVRDELGRLLFVQERSDSWDLPGGGLEHGEDSTEALKREFLEELETDIEVATENPLIIPTWNTTVSYTHLDVYKRQVHKWYALPVLKLS